MESLGIGVAACSAAGFALSTSLQHHSADRAPSAVRSTRALLVHLAGRPWWIVGQLVAVGSFVLHALALRIGTIVTVQPVVVSGIVLAVPARAALSRRLPSWGEVTTVAVTAIGLAVLLVASRPTAGRDRPDELVAVVLTAAGVCLAGGAVALAARCRDPHHAATWLGIAAGILFGLVAGLVKLAFAQIGNSSAAGPSALLHSWAVWAVPVVGLGGVVINQRAYRAARLSASMPILNIIDVIVALAFGVAVFRETPAHTPAAVVAQALALVCMAIGLRRLSRSPAFEPDPAATSRTEPADPAAGDVVNPRSRS
jgi:drug/metabolite transporter (DMT)-like permease